MDSKTIIVKYQGVEPFTAEPIKIGSFCDKTPALPESLNPKVAEAFRMLEALEKQHNQSCQWRSDAISFGGYRKDGGSNV